MPAAALKLLYQICTYTNCFPPYDFTGCAPLAASQHIVYVLAAAFAIVAQYVFATYGRCAILQLAFSFQIADAFANLSLSAGTLLVCILCYHVGNKYVDKLGLLFGAEEESFPRCNTLIVITHLVFLLLIAFDVYVTLYHFYDGAIYYYAMKYLQYYAVISLILFVVLAAKRIRRLVTRIMDELLENINGFLLLPVAEMRESDKGLFTLTGWTKSALDTKASMRDVDNVQQAAKQYKDVYMLCYYFNEVFGWPTMFVIGVVLFEVIQMMNYAVQYPSDHHAANNVWYLCLRCLIAIYFYALQTWMILSCDSVTEEVTHFSNQIYKQILVMSEVQDSLAEQLVLKELVTLWYHVTNNKPHFQAGIIILSRKFIYGSFIGVSSFIAVIVEFNKIVYGDH